jgi:hypothetical protein
MSAEMESDGIVIDIRTDLYVLPGDGQGVTAQDFIQQRIILGVAGLLRWLDASRDILRAFFPIRGHLVVGTSSDDYVVCLDGIRRWLKSKIQMIGSVRR